MIRHFLSERHRRAKAFCTGVMSSLDMSVTLIVKAPNQQIEDQTIQCDLSWTIKHLKGYLSEVYPSKPRTEEQKLIYSGHLLNDSCTLREVLRTYEEGQDQHTVHLVCARNSMVPPKKPDAAGTSSEIRRRHTGAQGASASSAGASSSNSSVNANSSSAASSSSNVPDNTRSHSSPSVNTHPSQPSGPEGPAPPAPDPRQAIPPFYPGPQIPPFAQFPQMPPYVPPQVNPWTHAQYAAWMHQAYAQYMTQYMQMMSQGSASPFPWQLPPNVSVRGPQPNFEQPGAAPGQAGNVERAAGAEEGEEDENGGRDWLDWFYMTSRAAAVFAFIYFYTTPMRFLFVFCLALLMYLYKIGFFRPLDEIVQVVDNNNDPARVDAAAAAANNVNNDNNNNHQPPGEANPAAAAAAAAAAPPAPAAPAPHADGAEGNAETPENNAEGVVPAAGAPAQPPVPDRPSLLALTWTFFTSFFASLIPEQPGVI
ncbi:homocysteine-responsive endoplasmic reticulum-resident ubiquitin-like domain member 2 protein isoform X2 [Thrips palmi]|uniref:Homocysteine-responsive endoplasmic reticulum-resident ubiquitin-like domain member 2 protein isoform X2 n=1 Tax=Thrips palmi TaxID=161013 RepID=A0A6P8Z3D4_THRPL|nr:homocysteine-responsive endoplasmic reticulum-resident ubiquitin-like domain member 2 protein isoform X2 [Thrips palmi]